MKGCVQYAVYAVYGYKHRGAAKGDGDLRTGLVRELRDLLQHPGRQDIKSIVLISGKNTEPVVERLILRVDLVLCCPSADSRGEPLLEDLQMTGTLFHFVEGGEVHDLAVKKGFFPAVVSGSLHTGGRDITVPELEALIAAGQ